jgi:hypothetical protein
VTECGWGGWAQKLAPEWDKVGKHLSKKWKKGEFNNVALAKVGLSAASSFRFLPTAG